MIWRKFYGAIKIVENEYRRRWNSEIYQMYDDIDIISFIRQIGGRLRWLGHVCRMEDDNPCKKILEENIYNKDREVDLDTAGGRRCWRISKAWESETERQNSEIGMNGKGLSLRPRSFSGL